MAQQDDELDLEKLRREVDTLTQQVGGKPVPGTTTRLPAQEKPEKKKKGNPIMYGLIGVAAILVGGKLIFSVDEFPSARCNRWHWRLVVFLQISQG